MNHITLSGELGSGKSTVANYLIGKMPFKIVSAGLLFRQLAAKHGMSAKEFNQFIENDPKYDHYVDDTMAELGRTDEKIIFISMSMWTPQPNVSSTTWGASASRIPIRLQHARKLWKDAKAKSCATRISTTVTSTTTATMTSLSTPVTQVVMKLTSWFSIASRLLRKEKNTQKYGFHRSH